MLWEKNVKELFNVLLFFVYMLALKVAEKKSGWIHSGLC